MKPVTKSSNQKTVHKEDVTNNKLIYEVWGFVLIAVGIFIFAALVFDAGGIVGENIALLFKGCFGILALTLPFFILISGIILIIKKTRNFATKTIVLMFAIFLLFSLLNSGRFVDANNTKYSLLDYYELSKTYDSGGLIPMAISGFIVSILGKVGLYIFGIVGIIISVLLLRNKPLSSSFGNIENKISTKKAEQREKKEAERIRVEELRKEKEREEKLRQEILRNKAMEAEAFLNSGELIDYRYDFESGKNSDFSYLSNSGRTLKYTSDADIFGSDSEKIDDSKTENRQDVLRFDHIDKNEGTQEKFPANSNDNDIKKPEKTISNKEAKEAFLSEDELNKTKPSTRYKLPTLNLLVPPEPENKVDTRQLRFMAAHLEDTLSSFNVDAKVINVTQGPAITRYEIQPNVGVKVSKIVSLADDIALNLRAKSIRIEAPIPGKAAVGIEVENGSIHMVRVSELISSRVFKSAKSKIAFGVGKDISGNPIVSDIKSMPHLLIAGSTGSGKSVCINSMIASILYKAKPDEVKLILVDPKVVELGNYNGIPHLLIPVVTEPAKAAAALNWAVVEMNERYNKFAKLGVRDLESYNEKMIHQGSKDDKLPQIVIIVDELADLMMAAPSQVEESICRLAQKARAAGMHIVVATQRPSVDVITGLIKANIPSRIAFAVSSQFDSRTILDMSGAEKLVGNGDMLYNPMGIKKPKRVQGCFISDQEVNNIIEYVKSQVEEVEYSGDVIKTIENDNLSPKQSKGDEDDELMSEAIECVINAGQASVSMLQRRFRIGYNRAARIVDAMEERGIVGPQDGSKPRQVLLTEDEFQQMSITEE
ncbi:MAG: DNA translocase FtsK [Anaerovoracaceae bacterium]|nr:DNA translocase FtsK [Anaerovoracaceae bacterium]